MCEFVIGCDWVSGECVSVWVYECVFDNTISTHAIVLQQR